MVIIGWCCGGGYDGSDGGGSGEVVIVVMVVTLVALKILGQAGGVWHFEFLTCCSACPLGFMIPSSWRDNHTALLSFVPCLCCFILNSVPSI